MGDKSEESGIYTGVSFADYQQIEAVNSTLLCNLWDKTALHAKHDLENPGESDTEAKEFGRLLHLAILEPDTFAKVVVTLPPNPPRRPSDKQRLAANQSDSTIASIQFWDAWEADPREKISQKSMADLLGMQASIRRNQCLTYVTGGQAEVTVVWIDKKTGLTCKARLDFYQPHTLEPDRISDIKTKSGLVSAPAFRKEIFNRNYHLKAAFYCDGVATLTEEEPDWTWLAVEKQKPYVSKPWQMGDETRLAGRNRYRKMLDLWAECLKSNRFEAYGDNVEILELERWMLEADGVNRFQILPEPDLETDPLVGLTGTEAAEAFAKEYGL